MEIKNVSRRRKAQLILASHYYRSVKEDARCRREILMLDPGRPGPKCVAKRIRDDLTDRGAERIKPKGATVTAAPIFDFDQTESCLLWLEFRDETWISNNRSNRTALLIVETKERMVIVIGDDFWSATFLK